MKCFVAPPRQSALQKALFRTGYFYKIVVCGIGI